MKQQRPVYLNLMQIRLPLPGFVSILHRASGVMLFFLLPLLLWLLAQSLAFQTSFTQLQETIAGSGLLRLAIWFTLSMLIYHLIAGIRHLIMDFGIGDSLRGGRFSAWLVLIISAVFVLLIGVWLW